MKIERIDTDEIIGLTCPITGHRILWDDEDIADVLPGTVVLAVITSLYSEECAVEGMPLAEAWNQHYASANIREMSLDESRRGFSRLWKGAQGRQRRHGLWLGHRCDQLHRSRRTSR